MTEEAENDAMASSSTNEGVGGSESSLAGYRAGGGEAFDVSNEAKVAELRHSIAKAFNAGNPDLPSNQVRITQCLAFSWDVPPGLWVLWTLILNMKRHILVFGLLVF